MRLFSFIVFVLVIWLATWSSPKLDVPEPTALPTQMNIPAAAFDSPSGWTIDYMAFGPGEWIIPSPA